jgi:hypothetical protein
MYFWLINAMKRLKVPNIDRKFIKIFIPNAKIFIKHLLDEFSKGIVYIKNQLFGIIKNNFSAKNLY